ncbi:hypothetical protein PDQ77_25880 [Bacillus cereus]|uniref:hypothetical protein n=1 Tax=Bacillus cereus group TaxID=86661 RepID=UPI000BFCC043|nr:MULTISPECIES: hypothetical protein [Bacillus cereus group]MDA2650191.1 hypothetical protein [Bacillus cereus]PHC13439.1 hypothetical protein COF03_26215 [Bacillus toyonensis]PHD96618.1 hypothetical protein COF43_22440 [Bacillus toyonensis]
MYSFLIQGAEIQEVEDLKQDLSKLLEESNVELIPGKSFNGVNDIILIIATLGGGTLTIQVAKVLVAWMNRNNTKEFKFNGKSFKGYTAEEVVKIIRETK